MRKSMVIALEFAVGLGLACTAFAQQQPLQQAPKIDFVVMGGNDCPPCKVWRGTELPKLQAMPEWKLMQYHYITKTVNSAVPPALFFPSESKHLQPALAAAGAGVRGSQQAAILVDGKVVDYWWGSAKSESENLAAFVRAIHEGKPLTRPTCTKLGYNAGICAQPG